MLTTRTIPILRNFVSGREGEPVRLLGMGSRVRVSLGHIPSSGAQPSASSRRCLAARTARSIVTIMTKSNAALMRQAAREFGRMGGHARAKALTAEQRKRIARRAARARWGRRHPKV